MKKLIPVTDKGKPTFLQIVDNLAGKTLLGIPQKCCSTKTVCG